MKGLLTGLVGSRNVGVAVGLPAGQNMVEGTEAAILVGAASANAGRRRARVAAIAGLISLAPYLAGMWFLYKYEPGQYIDYAIAVLIFWIGVREIKEGLEDRPTPADGPGVVPGPLGVDYADPDRISAFQGEHGLEQDGVVGPRTRGAIVAELARRAETASPVAVGVDVTDEESVKAFQRRVGLRDDGVIGARTQGALAAEATRDTPDATRPDSVKRFQRRFDLRPTGVVDARTQGALRAARAARSNGTGAVGWLSGRADGPRQVYGIDLSSAEQISRFRRERGLSDAENVDARMQGALRAEVEWRRRQLGVDAADPVQVRTFQTAHGLPATGVVDKPTQRALGEQQARLGTTDADQRKVLGLDPTDPESVRRFQALHQLDRTGEIDGPTRSAMCRTEEWTAGIDLTDPSDVSRFQSGYGLSATGYVDEETQGVLRLIRTELRERHASGGDGADGSAGADGDGWYPLDPTDPASITRFQDEHQLSEPSERGRIGPQTQAALRAELAKRTKSAERDAESGRGPRTPIGRFVDKYKDAWPAYVGVLVEGGEAGLFTIGVAHGTGSYLAAGIAGGSGFTVPWVVYAFLRGWIESWPKWVFELTVGCILAAAATIFGLFRATGVFGA